MPWILGRCSRRDSNFSIPGVEGTRRKMCAGVLYSTLSSFFECNAVGAATCFASLSCSARKPRVRLPSFRFPAPLGSPGQTIPGLPVRRGERPQDSRLYPAHPWRTRLAGSASTGPAACSASPTAARPHGKDCSYNPIAFPPSLVVRCGGYDCRDAGGRATPGAVAENRVGNSDRAESW